MMTSRQRKRKAGLMRIDAALDSLCPMGFSRNLVRQTVNKLLKAYGGDQGWAFIEEASYKVVIEAILEEQESQEKAGLENTQPKLLGCSSSKAESVAQSQTPHGQSPEEDSRCVNQSVPSDATGHSYTSQAKVTAEDFFPAQHIHSEAPMNRSKHSLEHKVTTENCRAMTVAEKSPEMCSRSSMELGSHSIIKKRKPCFGWISDDENDGNDLVYLLPAP